jgi:16S rRNA (cytidine1402-2'-O)-methyltransferase
MPGTCYVSATPIGNLSDVSSRLITTLESVHTIFSEDTRVTRVLLDHFSISTPLVSLQKFNEKSRVDFAVSLLSQGHDIAVVSDAGTPCISDPGALFAQGLIERGTVLSPIPGPSALTSLLSVAGVPVQSFYFGSFFPKLVSERKECLERLLTMDCPGVFFESPNRLIASISLIEELYPDAYLVLGKEITKHFEKFLMGTPSAILSQLKELPSKGEWCFLVQLPKVTKSDLEETISRLYAQGLTKAQVKAVATQVLDYPRNEVYKVSESLT